MSEIAATIISILQAFVFCIIGPTTLLFGPIVAKSVTVVQSFLASGYLSLLNSVMAVKADSVMVVLEGAFYMFSGALTMAFATLKSETGNQVMKGMATGYLVAEPLLALISETLYAEVAGCTRLGAATIEFPQGQPMGPEEGDHECYPDGKIFLACFYTMKALTWIATLGSGKLGIIFAEFFLVFSSAMTGASMTVAAFRDLILSIAVAAGGKEFGAKLVTPLAGVTMILTYSLAGVGFLVMRGMAKRFRAIKERKERKKRKKEKQAGGGVGGDGEGGGKERGDTADGGGEKAEEKPEEEEQEKDGKKDTGKKSKKVVPAPDTKTKSGDDGDDGPLPEPEGLAKYVFKYCSCFKVMLKLMEKLETWIEKKLDADGKKEDGQLKKKTGAISAVAKFKQSLAKGKGAVVPSGMVEKMKEKSRARAEKLKEVKELKQIAKEKAKAQTAKEAATEKPKDEPKPQGKIKLPPLNPEAS